MNLQSSLIKLDAKVQLYCIVKFGSNEFLDIRKKILFWMPFCYEVQGHITEFCIISK